MFVEVFAACHVRAASQLIDWVALYAGGLDSLTLDGEPVTSQPGEFYSAWITTDVIGPCNGDHDTWGR